MAGAGEQLAGFPELLFGKARGSSRHSTGMGHTPQAEPSRAEPSPTPHSGCPLPLCGHTLLLGQPVKTVPPIQPHPRVPAPRFRIREQVMR